MKLKFSSFVSQIRFSFKNLKANNIKFSLLYSRARPRLLDKIHSLLLVFFSAESFLTSKNYFLVSFLCSNFEKNNCPCLFFLARHVCTFCFISLFVFIAQFAGVWSIIRIRGSFLPFLSHETISRSFLIKK